MAAVDDFTELASDTVTAQPGSVNEYGEWTDSGSAVSLDAYIESEAVLVKDITGRELVSSVQIFDLTAGGPQGLTVDGHRYTLPARYTPNANLVAMKIEIVQDEDGPHHEVVYI